MNTSEENAGIQASMPTMEVIYSRRAVRDYLPGKIDAAVIHQLLDAAVHAPTAIHEEPWAFVIFQDKVLLDRLSDSVKEGLISGADPIHPLFKTHGADRFVRPDFNVFYNAGTLVVIYGKPLGPFVVADCWLAAENLMLAACSMGLGTCPIGLAVAALNSPQWKQTLGVPSELTAYAPIIVGKPASDTPAVPRKPPEIVCWK